MYIKRMTVMTLLFYKSYPDSSSSPYTSLSVSTPNTIHHKCDSHITDSPDLDHLPIDFVLNKRLRISRFPRLCFCRRCSNLEFTVTITMLTRILLKRTKSELSKSQIKTKQ